MSKPFRVAVSRDFLKPEDRRINAKPFLDKMVSSDGSPGLDSPESFEWEFLAEHHGTVSSQQLAGFDALFLGIPRISSESLGGTDRLKIISRFGVGYDSVDVDACTQHGVLLTITPDGVRRPVAASAITFLLALSHKLCIKDRLTRAGRWADRLDYPGQGLTGRTLGVIGLGNIGREILRLASPFQMKRIGHDPHVDPQALSALDVELVDLEQLLAQADYVVVSCSLTTATRRLINAERLALMRPTAYLINVARGPIVDQAALIEVLQKRRIQGAGLDVFEEEPIDPGDPLLKLENVIVTPHAICLTDECFREIVRQACRSIVAVAGGKIPEDVVNREVLSAPNLRARLVK